MGFNNGGQAAAIARLERHGPQSGLTGINIGANKDAADRIADYASGVRNMAPLADYLTINISSPNTPGLRALQDKGALDALLAAVMVERGSAGPRSEEHTSELQSLMRISYAVFCLKKKKKNSKSEQNDKQ